jgi:hypothetical protein
VKVLSCTASSAAVEVVAGIGGGTGAVWANRAAENSELSNATRTRRRRGQADTGVVFMEANRNVCGGLVLITGKNGVGGGSRRRPERNTFVDRAG